MDIEELNRELTRAVAALSGRVTPQSVSADDEVPDVVNDAELMEALKRAYDGICAQRGNLGDPQAYWAEAGFPPHRSSGRGPTAHEALGHAIADYFQKAAASGRIEPPSASDRRCGKDRRSWDNKNVTYPFVDSNGVWVTEDRRVRPDRRLNNIEAHWSFDRRPR